MLGVANRTLLLGGGVLGTGAAATYLALRDGGPAHQHRETIGVIARNLHHPGALLALHDARNAAIQVEIREYGRDGHFEDAPDALRHATGTALGVLALMRDEDMSQEQATKLVRDFGNARERGGAGGGASISSQMDFANNDTGMTLVGDGRAADGSWLTDEQAQQRVLDALGAGALVMVDGDRLVPTHH